MRVGARFGRLKKTLLFFLLLTCFIMLKKTLLIFVDLLNCFIMLNYIGPLLNAHLLIRAMIDKIRGMMIKAKKLIV